MRALSVLILYIVTNSVTEGGIGCEEEMLRNSSETLYLRKWVIIIYEGWSEMLFANIWKEIGLRYQLIRIDEVGDEEFSSVIERSVRRAPGIHLHFIVAVRKKSLRWILEQINFIDGNSTKSINIRHWSTWLLVYIPEMDLYFSDNEVENGVGHSGLALRNSSLWYDDTVTKTLDFKRKKISKTVMIQESLAMLRDVSSEFDNMALLSAIDEKSIMEFCKVWTLFKTHDGPSYEQVNSGNGLTSDTIFPNLKNGYNGRRFLVLTKMWKPFIYEQIEKGVLHYKGYLVELMDLISQQLNFSYTFYDDKESDWLSYKNGSFNKYLTGMMQGKYDLMCLPGGSTSKKSEAVDFVFPAYFSDKVLPIYRKQAAEISMWLYLKPLNTLTLVVLLTTCLVFCISFWMLERYNPYNRNVNNACKRSVGTRLPPCLGDVFHYVVGVVFNQGGSIGTRSSSGRLFLAFFWIFCIIMSAVYRGNLVAFLALKQPPKLINSIDDLLNSGYIIGMVGSSSLKAITQNHSIPKYRKLYELHSMHAAANPEVASKDNEVHLKSVLKGGYVYVIGTSSTISLYTEHCDTELMTEALVEKYFALATPKNSPLRYDLEKAMLHLEQSGILLNLQQKWWPSHRADLCEQETKVQQVPVHLQDICSIFIVMTVCVITGFIVLYVEIVWKRLRVGRRQTFI